MPIDPTQPKVDQRHKTDADEWAVSGVWVKVRSSNVSGIMYDMDKQELHVTFNSGGEYVYLGVHPVTAKAMFASGSMGRFVHGVLIRGGYKFRRAD